jgi:hypothetical protein
LLQKFIFYKMQDCLFVRLLSCLAHLLLDLILSELHQRILEQEQSVHTYEYPV